MKALKKAQMLKKIYESQKYFMARNSCTVLALYCLPCLVQLKAEPDMVLVFIILKHQRKVTP